MITGRSDPVVNTKIDIINSSKQIDIIVNGSHESAYENQGYNKILNTCKNLLYQHENTIYKTVFFLALSTLVAIYYYKHIQKDQKQQQEVDKHVLLH